MSCISRCATGCTRSGLTRMNNLRDWWGSLMRRKPASGAQQEDTAPLSAIRPDNRDEPASISNPRVLLMILNPRNGPPPGIRLSDEMGWGRPDDLVRRFITEILQASGGLVRYQIAERVQVEDFPRLADGFQYDAAAYRTVIAGTAPAPMPSHA